VCGPFKRAKENDPFKRAGAERAHLISSHTKDKILLIGKAFLKRNVPKKISVEGTQSSGAHPCF